MVPVTRYGGGAGIRTPDTANMSRMLYQLSYTAVRVCYYIKHDHSDAIATQGWLTTVLMIGNNMTRVWLPG